jgi:hypothetical protein
VDDTPGDLLDRRDQVVAHRALISLAGAEHELVLPSRTRLRSPVARVSCSTTAMRSSLTYVRALVGPRPVNSGSRRTTALEIVALTLPAWGSVRVG